ncbi:hypothetical protein CPB84DRAFT_1800521 [Gymnopilus junonius]|uniref:Uncharacterized protein n=1 Tax=Gymnopilus junonius TaxID=109634 RepID=A0A9P5N7A0_GYMJU|nr:hypothetical protein CPB84DRAFT_1800521 [Gymnopilus junonius]
MAQRGEDQTTSGGFSQDFEGSDIRTGDGGYGGRGGDIGSYNMTSNSNNVNKTSFNFYGPQFIVNAEGRSLDLSLSDKSEVISYPFHGGLNQQWLVQDDGNEGVTLMSNYNKSFVALGESRQGSSLVSSNQPFYWNIDKDDGGYKLTALHSDLVLSLGDVPALRLSSDAPGTRLYILENTPENKAAIKSGKIIPPAAPSMTTTSDMARKSFSTGANINIIINDISGSGNAANALRGLQNFLESDGVKNLTICLGHHQSTGTSSITSSETTNTPSPPAPSFKSVKKGSMAAIGQMTPVTTLSPGTADVVGFGTNGVVIMRNRLNPQTELVVPNFGYNAGGWRLDRHVRLLADTTGDGRADIVGFGENGFWVAINQGNNTFAEPKMVKEDFAYSAGQWRIENHLRFMADLRNNGRADIIGFGYAGVLVSLNNGDGTFGPSKLVLQDFGYNSGGWRLNKHPRFLADLTGNGLLDIVGFGETQVWVALNKGDGTFQQPKGVLQNLCVGAGGWSVERHPRFVADLTGDGKADLIGFGASGVHVSFNKGNGTFHPPRQVIEDFCYNTGWRVDKHPRFVADLTGNGSADIIGFGTDGVIVAINNGNGTFQPPKLVLKQFGYNDGWRIEKHARFVADMTGDGRPDIVGLSSQSVYVSYNDGKGSFGSAKEIINAFGSESAEWAMDKTLKYVANL